MGIAYDKSRDFAVRIVNLYKYLFAEKNEGIMSAQLLRCGTSIGANLAEAETAITEKDFLSKIYIALKECNETIYWLELLKRTDYLTESQFSSINTDALSLKLMLSSTTKTIRDRKTRK